jgi:hypothetical protein
LPFISSQTDFVETYVDTNNAFKKSLAEKLIESMNLNIHKDLKEVFNINSDFHFFIPPFLAIVLDNVRKGATFGTAILEVRNKFKSLRVLFSDYNAIFYDDSGTLKKRLKESSKIINEIEIVSRSFSYRDRTMFKLWGDTFDFIIDSATDIINFNLINSAKLLPRLIRLPKAVITNLIVRKRYDSIFKLKTDFYNIKEYSTLLVKATGPISIEAAQKYPDGYICVSPGNPFADPDTLYESELSHPINT